MSGRARLTLCSAAATLMASCALLPLLDPATWLVQAAFMLAVQSAAGAAARRVPLARPLTVAAQALVTLVMLTLVFAREQALAGLIPGPEAFRHFGDLLRSGADDVGRYAIPAPLSDGIRLMVIGAVLVIGLVVDTLAVTFRNAAPAGLLLLALYSVAAGLSDGAADWLWFLVAAAGYLLLLLAEGRERLSQWGRVFGGSGRGPGGQPGPVAPVRTGRRIGMAALGVALVVPLLPLPAIQGGLLGATGAGVGAGNGGGGTISAVNPLVSLRDSLNVDDDRTVLTLRTNTSDLSGMYLRIVSLDEFDGTTWRPAKRHIVAVPDDFPAPTGLGPDVKRTEITTRIAAVDDYAQDWLPMPYPPSGVQIKGNWRYEPVGMTLVGDHGQNTSGKSYQVKSLDVQPTAQQLAAAPQAPDSVRRDYTKVPDSLPPVVAKQARQITRGADNDYERAVALQDYFAVTGGFEYDTQVEVGNGPNAIARFLRDKQGFCVHFSFAMASMARTLGIPARVAVGFAPGSPQADGSVAVGLRDAHAWPELYFEGVGWTRFEPTPTRGTTPTYTVPDSPGAALPEPPQASRSADAAPSTAPSARSGCSAQEKKLEDCANALPVDQPGQGGGGTPGTGSPPGRCWGRGARAAAAADAVAAEKTFGAAGVRPALRGGLRGSPGPAGQGGRGRRGRERLRAGGPAGRARGRGRGRRRRPCPGGVARAHRHGVGLRHRTGRRADPRRAAARIVRTGGLDETAGRSVHRVAGAVEQVLYAPEPRAEAGLADEVRTVRAALQEKADWTTRVRAVVAPRSAVRALWDVADRWTALRSSWTARLTALVHRPSGQQSG